MIRGRNFKTCLIIIFLLGIGCPAAAGRTIYVDNDEPADFNTIQDAIDDSNDGDTIVVANGIYTGEGNRDISFLGKTITVKSDNGPDKCIIDCNGTEAEPHRGFYFHNSEDSNSVLEGFTIVNGYGPYDGDIFSHGGAIYCTGSSPTISYCTFVGNWAEFGGGIECRQSNARILNSTFTSNFANSWGGGLCFREGNPVVIHCIIKNNTSGREGGGINYGGNQNPTINYCTISGNSSGTRMGGGGGGISLGFGKGTTAAKICNCIISRNSADYDGGGIVLNGPFMIHNTLANVTITNCIITENSSESRGGGIACMGASCIVNNCTISGNTAMIGGSIYCDASSVNVSSSVLRSNRAAFRANEIALLFGLVGIPGITVLEISYSNVEGGQTGIYLEPFPCILNWGLGNIDVDPCFADPGYWDPNGTPPDTNDDFWIEGNYQLKSQAGRWEPNSQIWIQDDVTSPCIDAGNPVNPIGLEPFPNGGRINMGAYGGTAEASKSYFGRPSCEIIVAGDINGDCRINFIDFAILANNWLQTGPAASIFDYSVATRGALNLQGNINMVGAGIFINANVYIESLNDANALSIKGNSSIYGDVFIINPDAIVTLQGGQASIGGETGQDAIDNHVHFGAPSIEFPVPEPNYFRHYVQNIYDPNNVLSEYDNVLIPAGTNPSFGDVTFRGIIFIEAPNMVYFLGNTEITGIIVGNGDLNDNSGINQIGFAGTVTSHPVADLPAEPQFDQLREEAGTFLMAPGFKVIFLCNFNILNGAIAANGIEFGGNAGGTINGSIINYSDEPMTVSCNSDLFFNRSGSAQIPAGFD